MKSFNAETQGTAKKALDGQRRKEMVPPGQNRPATLSLWGRTFASEELEVRSFQAGDRVEVQVGDDQRSKGVVEKVMPVKMLVKVTEGLRSGNVIKCDQSSARWLGVAQTNIVADASNDLRNVVTEQPRAEGPSAEEPRAEEPRAGEEILQLMTEMEQERVANMKQLTQLIQLADHRHEQKMTHLLQLMTKMKEDHTSIMEHCTQMIQTTELEQDQRMRVLTEIMTELLR